MAKHTPIVNPAGDFEESVQRYAKHLGKDKLRRRVFNNIYGRSQKPRSLKAIATAVGFKKGKSTQPVQNALNHLSSHGLIARVDNEGHVKDGSRYVYAKEDFIRVNRATIIRLADNTRAAKNLQTKRNQTVNVAIKRSSTTSRTLKAKKRLNVLYLVSNPDANASLRVDAEVRKVQEEIRGSRFRDNINVEYRPAADIASLVNGLNDHRPQIVHFSGHGNRRGIATDTGKTKKPKVKMVSFSLLAKALSATDSPPVVVVLNSCESSGAKNKVLSKVSIVISMNASISDVAATVFAQKFYAAIAGGQSVKAAFEQGKVAIEYASLKETKTPELLSKKGVNPKNIVLT